MPKMWPGKILLWTVIGALLAVSVAAAERMAIVSDIANIRSGPGTEHDILWQVYQNYPIEVIEKQGAWYRFRDFEGDIGWIHSSLVEKVATVITKAPKCNVRSGPGTHHDIAFTVVDGISFRLLERKGDWLHVRHADGDSGWIYRSLVW